MQQIRQLQNEIVRLNKVVQALMNRAERSMTTQGSDFGVFQTTILLEDQVRSRTEELEMALHENEKITRALQQVTARMEAEIQVRKQAEARVLHMACHDALTGLPNRVLLEDRIHQSIAQSRRERTFMAVLFIDLDKFKPVNDKLGHKVGDAVLREAANRMRDCLREGDSIARLGGDEFVICLSQLRHLDDVSRVIHKLQAVLMQPMRIDDHEVCIGGSIGVGLYPQDGNSAQALMQAADEAMYAAKGAGGGGYRFKSAVLDASRDGTA